MDEQDKLLPIANVSRIMKQMLPPTARISKEAKEVVQECATEFISFITGEASDKCRKENRKTMNGDDVCWALKSLGFDAYGEAILIYLHKYRDFEEKKVANSATTTGTNLINPCETSRDDKNDEKKNEDLTILGLGGATIHE